MDQPALQVFVSRDSAEATVPIARARQVIDCYLNQAPPSSSADATKERQRIFDLFIEQFGERQIETLRPYELLFWINSHEGWLSNHTRNRVRTTIQRPFNFATKLGLIDRNPLAGVSYPAGETGRDLTEPEFRALLRAARAPFRRVLFFLRCTGCRPVELRRLEWTQVNAGISAALQKIHKTARSTRRPRRIPLVPVVLRLLEWIKRRQPRGEKFVFTNADGKPWTKRAICQHMQRVREAAGLPPDVKLYSNRHMFATRAILNGVDIVTLARLMGHESIRTTQVYLHLANKDDHLIDAAQQAVSGRKKH